MSDIVNKGPIFNSIEFESYLGSLQPSSRAKYTDIIELYIDTCSEMSINDFEPTSVSSFLQKLHNEELKTSTLRVFNSIIASYFLYGYGGIKLYEKCPSILKK